MYPVQLILISQFQSIVKTSCNVPVKATQQAFVIIDQRLATQLGKRSLPQVQPCPSLMENKATVFIDLRVLSPHTDMLCSQLHL